MQPRITCINQITCDMTRGYFPIGNAEKSRRKKEPLEEEPEGQTDISVSSYDTHTTLRVKAGEQSLFLVSFSFLYRSSTFLTDRFSHVPVGDQEPILRDPLPAHRNGGKPLLWLIFKTSGLVILLGSDSSSNSRSHASSPKKVEQSGYGHPRRY